MKSVFFRTWLVFAGIWLGYFGYVAYVDCQKYVMASVEVKRCQTAYEEIKDDELKALAFKVCLDAEIVFLQYESELDVTMRRVFGIPLELLLLFPICFFILGGFRKSKDSTPKVTLLLRYP